MRLTLQTFQKSTLFLGFLGYPFKSDKSPYIIDLLKVFAFLSQKLKIPRIQAIISKG